MISFDGWPANRFQTQLKQAGGSRLVLTVVAISVLMLVLLGRIFYLQVISYSDYVARSSNNRLEVVPIPPVRGRIFDRDGNLLAENIEVTQLGVEPSKVNDMIVFLDELSEVIPITAEERKSFLESVERGNSYDFHVLKKNLSDQQVARFAVDRYRFNAAQLQSELFREYTHGQTFAHVVGMVSRIDKDDLERVNPARYRGIHYIGKYGVEKSNENVLVGWPGYERVETNVHGQKVRRLSQELPVAGRDLILSLDIGLQKKAYELMGDKAGALLALDPRTGQVLAMVSTPSYEPNDFGIHSTSEKRTRWLKSTDSPMINRVIQGQYSPGSTIKPFFGIAAEELDLAEQKVNCTGSFQLTGSDHKFRCWASSGHGPVNLREAIAQSCDTYFYKLAQTLGIDEIYYYLSKFGFGSHTEVDLDNELTGLLPSREWKQYERNEPWYLADTILMGIGQGTTTVTALQLGYALSIIANRGIKVTPQIISKIVDHESGTETLIQPERYRVRDLNPKNFEKVIESMEQVVHGRKGTAHPISKGLKYRMAGKTGTVQLVQRAQDEEWDASKVPENLQPHGIFISFAPTDKPQILVVAIVENGGSGLAVAPLARSLSDHYLIEGQRLNLGDQVAVLRR